MKLNEDEIHELEILAHLEEKDFDINTCDKSYIDLVINSGKKSFNIITKLLRENDLLNNYVKENKIYKKNLYNHAEKIEKQIDLMLDFLAEQDLGHYIKEDGGELLGQYRRYNKNDWKEHFENEVKEGNNHDNN